MNALFGKKKPQQNQQDVTLKTIQDLDKKIGEMEEKIKFIEVKKNNLNEQAKTKLKGGDKNGARQALAKKKKYDEQITIKQIEELWLNLDKKNDLSIKQSNYLQMRLLLIRLITDNQVEVAQTLNHQIDH